MPAGTDTVAVFAFPQASPNDDWHVDLASGIA